MTKDATPEVRALVFELEECETRAAVEDVAERLGITLEAEREAAERVERERRRRTGGTRILPTGTAQAVADDFNAMIARAKAEQGR